MITITPAALDKLTSLLSSGQFFRIAVSAGGCNGFSQSFELDTVIREDDCQVEELVVIDACSAELIGPFALDYETSIVESKFVLRIPAAQSFCGCGKSFNI